MTSRLVFVINHVPIPWVNNIAFPSWKDLSILADTRRVTLLALDNRDLRSSEALEAVKTLREMCEDVVIFDRKPTSKVESAMRRVRGVLAAQPSTMAHNIREDCRSYLKELVAQDPDIDIYVGDFFVASILEGVKRQGRAMIRLHNLESVFMRESFRAASSLLRKPLIYADVPLTKRAERRIFAGLNPQDTILTCTNEDRVAIERGYKTAARVDYLPLCAPYEPSRVPERAAPVDQPVAVFTGILSNPLNLEGIHWFVRESWPRVLEQIPAAKLLIAGRRPNETALALGRVPGVTVIPDPPDMNAVLTQAAVCIAPIFHGAGVKQKCLEAFLWRLPLVATTKGAEGLAARPGEDFLLADSPGAFAAAVSAIFRDRKLRERLATNGRRYLDVAHGDQVRREVLERALS